MSKDGPVDGAAIQTFLEDADEYIVVIATEPLDEEHGRVVGILSGVLEALVQDPASPRLRADLAKAIQAAKAADLKPFGRHVFDGLSYIEFAEKILASPPGRPVPASNRGGLRQELDDHAKAMLDAAVGLKHPGVNADVLAELGRLSGALDEAAAGADSADRVRALVAALRKVHPTNPPMAPCMGLVTIAERWLRGLALKAPVPGPGAPRIEPGGAFRLEDLEAALRQDWRPSPADLRACISAALDRPPGGRAPDYGLMLIGAMLAGDDALRDRVIHAHHARNLDAYHRQKDSGMGEEDLGDRPTVETSERIVGDAARWWVDQGKGTLAKELRGRLTSGK